MIPDEEKRLAALRSYAILDTPPEQDFDRLTRLAAHICNVPIAIVSLVDEHRQWFKSVVGLDIRQTDRAIAFCAIGIHQTAPMVVHDASRDARFSSNPLVTGAPGIRFYTCVPLVSQDGFALGTFAVIDREPRSLDPQQMEALETLAAQTVLQLEHRRQLAALQLLHQERERHLETLQQQSEVLQIAGNVAKVGGWIADLAQGSVYWSPEVAAIHGVTQTTYTLDQARAFYAPEWRDTLAQLFRACAKDGVAFDQEMEVVTATGRRVWVRTLGQAVRDPDGVVRRLRGAVQDVSERRAAEQSLIQSQQRFRELADAMPQIVWTAEPDGLVDYANKAMFNYIGLSSAGPGASINWAEALHPDDQRPTLDGWLAAVRTGNSFDTEYRMRSAADGQYRWMLVKAQPVRDEAGSIVKWYGTATDIHDLKTSNQKVARLARALTSTLESITDGFFTVDRQLRFTYFNAQAEKLLGRSRESVLGQTMDQVFPQGITAGFQEACRGAGEAGAPTTLEAYSEPAGKWLDLRAYPSKEGLAAYFRDVTQQHQDQQALRASEERFKLVVQATADTIWDWDRRNDTLWWSEGAQGGFGLPQGGPALDGHSWTSRIHPEDLARVTTSTEAFAHDPAQQQWQAEYRFRRLDGSYAEVLDRGFAIRDATGYAVRMVGGMTDITERKAAAQQALLEAQTRNSILAVQQEIASADLSLDAVMDLMARRAMEMMQSSSAEVELIDGDELVCLAAAGSNNLGTGARVTLRGTLAELAIADGTAHYCSDTETHPHVNRAICRAVGVRSVLVAPLRAGEQTIGVLRLTSTRPHAFAQREMTSLLILSESLGGVITRQRIAEELRNSEEQYRSMFHGNPHPMCVYDPQTLRVLMVNRSAVEHYGYSEDEFLALQVTDLLEPAAKEAALPHILSIATMQRSVNALRRHVKKNGEIIDVEVSGELITFGGRPARLVLAHDVTARMQAQRELMRLGRAQRMLSACNEALIRAEDEQLLLERICQITVDIGGYRLAWVGFAHNDAARTVQPVAHAGQGAEILGKLDLSWSDQTPAGRGSVGRAIASGKIVVVEDVNTDPSVAHWRERVQAIGFKGIVSLPLRSKSGTLGVLCLQAPQALKASAEELTLLEELANDLAFGINNLRALDEQRRLQEAVIKVASAVSSQAGEAFFEHLVRNMVDALGAQAGYAARIDHGATTLAHSIAAVVDGQLVDNFVYPIDGTARDQLVQAHSWRVSGDAAQDYPLAPSLARYCAGGYIGHRLDNAACEPIGLVFVLFRQPLQHVSLAESTLKIFAARAAAELERQQSDARIRDQASLLDKAQDAIVVRGMDHRIQYWNRSCERMYGWTQAEALGQSILSLIYQESSAFLARTAQTIRDGEWTGEITQYSKSGAPICVEGRWTLVRDDAGLPKSILAINTDVSRRKEVELAVHRMAFYDALTGLPNRQLFTEKLLRAREDCVESGLGGALLFVNLDDFKTLNETLGHETGDKLLRLAGERIAACVPASATVARFGGDEFLVLLEGLPGDPAASLQDASELGARLLETLGQPFTLGAFQHLTTACIGIASFQHADGPVGELLKQADLALYHAKSAGRNSIRFFHPELQQTVARRAALESDLRLALARRELVLHYQPQVLGDGRLLGVEALLRWNHPVRGMVSPAEFIPLAEDTGLILAIGQWVVESACRLIAAWQAHPRTAGLTVSVNVSASQFRHPDFVTQVVDAMAGQDIPAGNLKLELTESLLVYDMAAIIEKMRVLKSHGVGFSLDDFGTGYSSLSYLKRMPLDQLKIDQSFVREVMTDPNDAAIARTVIALAHSLGLHVIAEGVELQSQREFLHSHGCDAYQGYLFSRPLPLEQLETRIHGWDAQALAA